MAVPPKYREMGDFHDYYSGVRKAPVLTIFVGGNHEASNHSLELFYGGWVAPNIYYMGAAGVLRCGPLRIAGISGIYKRYDYKTPHREQPPFNNQDIKSVYHIREYDVTRLLHIRTQVDIGISHDWPSGVEWMGDSESLFKMKPFFEEEARSNTLGSPVTRDLVNHLRPSYWFSAHLHCKFAAIINHSKPVTPLVGDKSHTELARAADGLGEQPKLATAESSNKNPEEIEIESDTNSVVSVQGSPPAAQAIQGENSPRGDVQEGCHQLPPVLAAKTTLSSSHFTPKPINNDLTRFLALDKCLPGRQFLQLLEIEPFHQSGEATKIPYNLEYDKQWLALNRVCSNDLGLGPTKAVGEFETDAANMILIREAEAWVEEHLVKKGKMVVPQNFEITAPTHDLKEEGQGLRYVREYVNPQTAAFCEMLQIPNPYPFDSSGRGSSDNEHVNGNSDYRMPRSHRGRGGDQWKQNRRGGRGRGLC